MHFSTALIFTSITAVIADHGSGSGPGNGGGPGMSMSGASSWITGYSVSGSSMYPVTGLTYTTTKTHGNDDMTTTAVGTYSMGHETGTGSHKGNSTSTKAPSVTSGSVVSLSTKASLSATTTAAAQVTANAGSSFEWSAAAAGLAAIAGLVMA